MCWRLRRCGRHGRWKGEYAVLADLLRGRIHARSPMPLYAARLQLRGERNRIIAAPVTDRGRGLLVLRLEEPLPQEPGVVERRGLLRLHEARRARGHGSATARGAACALLTTTAAAAGGHGGNRWIREIRDFPIS